VTGVSSETNVLYDERLNVPLRWWVQAIMFLATVWLAFAVALPLPVAWAATAVITAGAVALLLGYGSARVRVEGGVLLAGRDADARAFLLLRPYLKRSVRIEVTDPEDPAPYWLVSTRRPEELAGALVAAGVQ
jgi:hypothetical protein